MRRTQKNPQEINTIEDICLQSHYLVSLRLNLADLVNLALLRDARQGTLAGSTTANLRAKKLENNFFRQFSRGKRGGRPHATFSVGGRKLLCWPPVRYRKELVE